MPQRPWGTVGCAPCCPGRYVAWAQPRGACVRGKEAEGRGGRTCPDGTELLCRG